MDFDILLISLLIMQLLHTGSKVHQKHSNTYCIGALNVDSPAQDHLHIAKIKMDTSNVMVLTRTFPVNHGGNCHCSCWLLG